MWLDAQDPKDKLELKENVDSGVYVKELTTFVVKSAMEIDHVMQANSVYAFMARRSVAKASRPSGRLFQLVQVVDIKFLQMEHRTRPSPKPDHEAGIC